MNLKQLLASVVGLFIGFSGGLGGILLYESIVPKPYEWEEPPVIVNCYGEDFSQRNLIRSIDYWTLRGEHFLEYIHSPNPGECSRNFEDGVIKLFKADPDSLPPGVLATTIRKTKFLSIKSAIIEYRPGSFRLDLLNEHELGHALGYSHQEVEGTIMHPQWGKMGPILLD